MIRPNRNWIDPTAVPLPAAIQQFFPEHPFLGQALFTRGITSNEQANSFFDPGRYQPTPASTFPDIPKAVERITLAIKQGEIIGIWGDFDVDGQTSTALLVSSLKALGARVEYHIPVRATENHGIHPNYLEQFLQKGINLVISCDTGTTSMEAVMVANSRNVDIIITDHHSLIGDLPPAFALINPNLLPANHPFNSLSGVGTAFQLAKALLDSMNRTPIADSLLDLVSLGTIADLVTLNPENRYLVQKGLIQLRENNRKGLEALLKLAEVDPRTLTEEQISFVIAPRMNAIGRLGDANPMVEFLTTENEVEANKLAHELEDLNFRRKMAVESVFKGVVRLLENVPRLMDYSILVIADTKWETGVNGIVASRLVNQFNKPALVITKESDGTAHGSARSISGVDINQLISEQKDLLLNFGGHPMAAGFSIKTELIDLFRDRINNSFQKAYSKLALENNLNIDDFLSFNTLDLALADAIEKFAPFGPGNPRIILASNNVRILQHTPIGKNNEHLKIKAQDSTGNMKEILWWQGEETLLPQGEVDLAYSLRAHDFRGNREIQLEWIDWRECMRNELSIQSLPYKITDLRQENQKSLLDKLSARLESNMIIWAEGENISGLKVSDRIQLCPVEILVILTIPPARETMNRVLAKVKPKEIWLGNLNPGMDKMVDLLARLVGLLKHVIKEKNGVADLENLAALTSQTSSVVVAGIRLIAAQGHITIVDSNADAYKIGPGGQKNPDKERECLIVLKDILQEIVAFHRFYMSANPRQLFSK